MRIKTAAAHAMPIIAPAEKRTHTQEIQRVYIEDHAQKGEANDTKTQEPTWEVVNPWQLMVQSSNEKENYSRMLLDNSISV